MKRSLQNSGRKAKISHSINVTTTHMKSEDARMSLRSLGNGIEDLKFFRQASVANGRGAMMDYEDFPSKSSSSGRKGWPHPLRESIQTHRKYILQCVARCLSLK